jgi:hypothetical protein
MAVRSVAPWKLATAISLIVIAQPSPARNDVPAARADNNYGALISRQSQGGIERVAGPALAESGAASIAELDRRGLDVVGRYGGQNALPAGTPNTHNSPRLVPILVAGLALAGLIVWGFTGLPCLMLGHYRSRKKVRFSEREQRWVSNCRRCGRRLVRDPHLGWSVATPLPELRDPAPVIAPYPLEVREPEWPVSPRQTDTPAISFVEPRQVRPKDPAPPRPPLAEETAQTVIGRLLNDVLGGKVTTPGARGALFFVVDELRANHATDERTRRAERISIGIQQLECALQRGDEREASLVRSNLEALAGEWTNGGLCTDS